MANKILIFCVLFFFSVKAENSEIKVLNQKLIEQTVIDRLSPPQTSRILAYCNLAYYYGFYFDADDNFILDRIATKRKEILLNKELEFNGLNRALVAKKLFELTAFEMSYDKSNWSMNKQTKLDFKTETIVEKLFVKLKFLRNDDGFRERSVNGFYQVSDSINSYELTPPTYSEPIENNWEYIYTFLLGSIDSFQMRNDVLEGKISSRNFFLQNKKICKKTKKMKLDKIESAKLWDCNPVKVLNFGHFKKISYRMTPAAHWINILIDIDGSEFSEKEISEQFVLLSLSLADAFVVVWKNKYETNFIRPVSFINKNIDDKWSPLLDTPIFPEFPSGHSTVSTVASLVLERYYGLNYTFTDSTQYKYSGVVKTFDSFESAAQDAGYSRYYGGIHYIEAIEKGFIQGERIMTNLWQYIKEE